MIPELEQFGVQFLRGRFRWRAPTCGLPVPVRGIGAEVAMEEPEMQLKGKKGGAGPRGD